MPSAQQDEALATTRVIEIVNRPVTHLPRTVEAGLFSSGWFHDGAIKPDFTTAAMTPIGSGMRWSKSLAFRAGNPARCQ